MHVTCAVCATWHFRYNVVTESVVELDRLDETLYLDFRKRDTQAPYPRGGCTQSLASPTVLPTASKKSISSAPTRLLVVCGGRRRKMDVRHELRVPSYKDSRGIKVLKRTAHVPVFV